MLILPKKLLAVAGLGVATSMMMSSASAATITVDTEATIEAGASADSDENEAAAGYIFVKHQATVGNATRKAYFQFDLTGQDADLAQSATFTVSLQSNRAQALKFWVLDQAYDGFASTVTWNSAQANDIATNDLQTTGAFTATQIGGVLEVDGSTNDEVPVTIASLAPYVFGNKITFAISGAEWTGPDNPGTTAINGGMRFQLQSGSQPAKLDFAQIPEPSSLALLSLGGLLIARRRRG